MTPTITIINGFVLFAHRANWITAPTGKRVWETEIAEVLPGAETRQALRSAARRQLACNLTAATLPERSRLDARVDAAKKSGLACAPLRGRGCPLAQILNAGDPTLTLAAAALAWNWQPGDYAILAMTKKVLWSNLESGAALSWPPAM